MEVKSFNDFCENAKRRGKKIAIRTKDNVCYCGDFVKFSSAHGHEYVHILHYVEGDMIDIRGGFDNQLIAQYQQRSLRETPIRISDIEDYVLAYKPHEEEDWNEEQTKKNQVAYNALFAEM